MPFTSMEPVFSLTCGGFLRRKERYCFFSYTKKESVSFFLDLLLSEQRRTPCQQQPQCPHQNYPIKNAWKKLHRFPLIYREREIIRQIDVNFALTKSQNGTINKDDAKEGDFSFRYVVSFYVPGECCHTRQATYFKSFPIPGLA